MNKETQKEIVEVFDRLGWNYSEYCIETWSDAGEDLIIEGNTFEELVDNIKSEYKNFEVDEHVELWINIRGTRGVPSSVETLVEDAKSIALMYEELYNEIMKII